LSKNIEKITRIGLILRPHGLGGGLVVKLLLPHNLKAGDEVFLLTKEEVILTTTVERVAQLKKHLLLLKLVAVTRREEAEKYRELFVGVGDYKLPKDTYLISDLIGLPVYTVEGEYVGKFEDVFTVRGRDIYIIKVGDNEILIPAKKEFVKKIDLSQKVIIVDLPDNYLEIYGVK